MKKIARVYSTRIEIEPYEMGDIDQLERLTSVWDQPTFSRKDIAYFHTDNKLIIPRGISLLLLEKLIETTPMICYNQNIPTRMKSRYEVTIAPKNEEQENAIDFLLSRNDFINGKRYSQLALCLPTGFGKTYCAIHAMVRQATRTIIIVHKEAIKTQWISSILKMTTVPEERICNISGSEIIKKIINGDSNYDIFIVNHATITAFARLYSWDEISKFFDIINVGLKITDETHLSFINTTYIDFFSNVNRNWYLTATFERGDDRESRLFKRIFANTIKFGEDVIVRKHVLYTFIFFNTYPTYQDKYSIKTSRGVSSYKYADYAFRDEKEHTILKKLLIIMEKCNSHDGRTLVLVPKIDVIDQVYDVLMKQNYGKRIGKIHSKQSKEENNLSYKTAEIIIGTTKGLGTGDDIFGLRNIVVMEPYSSPVICKQLIGRLREYNDTDDTYVYELVDVGFDSILRMVQRRLPVIKKICKSMNKTEL